MRLRPDCDSFVGGFFGLESWAIFIGHGKVKDPDNSALVGEGESFGLEAGEFGEFSMTSWERGRPRELGLRISFEGR